VVLSACLLLLDVFERALCSLHDIQIFLHERGTVRSDIHVKLSRVGQKRLLLLDRSALGGNCGK
jgi:hypothetical protein